MASVLKETYQYGNTVNHSSLGWAEPSPQNVPAPKPTQPKKTKSIPRETSLKRLVIQIGIVAGGLFIVALSHVHVKYTLGAKQTTLNNLKAEKVALGNQITKIEAQINEKKDLKMIREKATEELNMQSPLAHQIVYIDITSDSESDC